MRAGSLMDGGRLDRTLGEVGKVAGHHAAAALHECAGVALRVTGLKAGEASSHKGQPYPSQASAVVRVVTLSDGNVA